MLKTAYGKKRKYNPISNRKNTMAELKQYSTQKIHEECEEKFLKLMSMIDGVKKEDVKKSEKSEGCVAPGAIPTIITDIKQSKALAEKNKSEGKTNSQAKNSKKHNEELHHDNQVQGDFINKNKLLELKELYEDGLITEEEYLEKRKQIIDKI